MKIYMPDRGETPDPGWYECKMVIEYSVKAKNLADALTKAHRAIKIKPSCYLVELKECYKRRDYGEEE